MTVEAANQFGDAFAPLRVHSGAGVEAVARHETQIGREAKIDEVSTIIRGNIVCEVVIELRRAAADVPAQRLW